LVVLDEEDTSVWGVTNPTVPQVSHNQNDKRLALYASLLVVLVGLGVLVVSVVYW